MKAKTISIYGTLQCRACGKVWQPQIKPNSNGKFYKGACKCPSCKA